MTPHPKPPPPHVFSKFILAQELLRAEAGAVQQSADMAEAFLLAVGADLRRTPEHMQKIVDTVVHDNWFEAVDDLRMISDKQWEDWKIPVNFVNKLKSKLAEACGDPLCLFQLRVRTDFSNF